MKKAIIKATLKRDKETANTIRYSEGITAPEFPIIGTIYIPKKTLGDVFDCYPDEIEVEITQ